MIKQGVWQGENIDYWAGEICLKIRPNVDLQSIQNYLLGLSLSLTLNFDKLGWGLINVQQERDIFGVIDTLLQCPLFESAEPNGVMYITSVPNDSLFPIQWGIHNTGQIPPSSKVDADIDAPEAWNISQGDTSILIAVLDTGIPLGSSNQLSHPDLSNASRLILGPDMIDSVTQGQYPDPEPDPTVRDSTGHGTHVTGIIAAESNNGIGVAGIANQCKILVIQVFCHNIVTTASNIEAFRRGVIYAVDHGAKIINYSGGVGKKFEALRDAVVYANNHDVIIVAAAGNSFTSIIQYPAAYSDSFSNVIAVGATDCNDKKSPFSNIGPALDVVAPGGYASDTSYENWFDANDIISTIPSYIDHPGALTHGAWYGYSAGTSMATPLVAGVAALIRSHYPSFTASQVKERIRYSADDVNGYTSLGRDDSIGYGRINAYRALSGTPAVPILFSPANNCTTAYSVATLIWHTATWATSYHLQVDDENTFTSPLVKDIQSITDTQRTDTYAPNLRFYWRVRAVNDSGRGEWSVVWSFVTGPAPPSISLTWNPATLPTIKKPCGQSCNPTYSDCYPKLSWSFQNGTVGPGDIYRYHCPSGGGDCGGPAQLMVDNQKGSDNTS